jgi:hypothetical protein
VREIVERAEIAARPGAVWRVVRAVADGDTADAPRIDIAKEPRELAWTSVLALVDRETSEHDVEVQWWFRLAPSWNGTEVEHSLRSARVLGAPDETAVRRRLVAQLASVKARVESTT